MRSGLLSSFVLLLATTATTQSPLQTTFLNNTMANAIGGTGVYFDLTVNVAMHVTQLDVNVSSAIGVPGTIEVYSTPLTYVGNVQNPAVWTQLGSGPVVSAGIGNPTTCILSAPILLLPGTYGIALAHVGLVAAYTIGTGTNQIWSNGELTLSAGASQNVAFSTANPFTPRVWNGRIHYTVIDPTWAQNLVYGTGCYDKPASFHETFPGGLFDLAGTTTVTNSIVMVPSNGGYLVTPGGNSWFTPVAQNLGLLDDGVSVPLNLPFAFSYPGGTTSTVFACSNGFVWLQPNNNTYYRPIVRRLLTLGPRLCPLWMDLNPTIGGSIHFDVDPSNQVVYVTWLNVPEYQQPATQNTMQVAIYANGNVEYRWRAIGSVNALGLVGWSPGIDANDPGAIDISTALPFSTGNGARPLALRSNARPVIGSTIQLATSDIPAGTAIGVVIMSLTQHNPGVPLAGLGMPGCFQYLNLDVSNLILPTGSSHNFAFTVPNDPAYSGLHLYCQSATFSAGVNALGVLASNGLDVRLGTL